MNRAVDVAIVGAGPYGLSLAAHLNGTGTDFRIFGDPMHTWREQMPKGMMLKSEGFASDLYDPGGTLRLRHFCSANSLAYEDIGFPVSLSTMVSYGQAFQQQMVPNVENKQVTALTKSGAGFTLRLSTNEVVEARCVVVATGTSYFSYIPPSLSHLPADLVSHSADHHDLSCFKSRNVVVIGAGSSALDLAAALQSCGAAIRLVARRPALTFNPPARADRPLWQRIRYPVSGIGFGLRSRFYTDAPILFHFMPERTRLRIVRTYLGPAGGCVLRDKITGRVPLLLGYNIEAAQALGGEVHLRLRNSRNGNDDIKADHVIAATGYRVDLRRMNFLDSEIRAQIRTVEHAPVLSRRFESSIPGLHFVGLASANSFGPVMRFMFGAGYTAPRLAYHLARVTATRSTPP